MNPDGVQDSGGDLPFLRKALDNLWSEQEKIGQFWRDLKARADAHPTYRVLCCVCLGTGQMIAVEESATGTLWERDRCPACQGAGSMYLVRERRGRP